MKKLFILFFLLLSIIILPSALSASTPSTIRIGLTGSFSNRDSIHISNTQIIAGYDSGGVFQAVSQPLDSVSGFTARVTAGVVALYSGNSQVFAFTDTSRGAQIRDAAGGLIRLGDYSYRGVIEIHPSGGRVTAINVICPEEYLFGVLPMEMSHSFHIEALKAQAIASRTFMMYRMNAGEHHQAGFHLCDGTHCQSYRGAGREHINTTRAVNETRGLMIYHNNDVILAVYFASSGGSTDNSENVWVQNRPYLRSVQDIVEYDPIVWTRTFTWTQLNAVLGQAGANIGSATGMVITQTGVYERVQELTIQGTSGQWQLRGEAIRTFFSPIGGALMSRNFYVSGANAPLAVSVTDGDRVVSILPSSLLWRNQMGAVVPISSDSVYIFDGVVSRRVDTGTTQAPTSSTGVTLSGRGWGHGVGMSQRGAHGMARLGYTYQEILLHYYTGVTIR